MKPTFKTEDEIRNSFGNVKIYNAIIQYIDLEIIGHFGNIVSLDMPIQYNQCTMTNPFNGMSSTLNCGVLIRTIFELLDIHEEDGIKLSNIKQRPCRIIISENNTIAVGNFMNDKFLIIEDFIEDFKKYIKEIKFN